MLDPKALADFQQGSAGIAEVIPSLCRQLYQGYLREEFTESQSMLLTQTYLVEFMKGMR